MYFEKGRGPGGILCNLKCQLSSLARLGIIHELGTRKVFTNLARASSKGISRSFLKSLSCEIIAHWCNYHYERKILGGSPWAPYFRSSTISSKVPFQSWTTIFSNKSGKCMWKFAATHKFCSSPKSHTRRSTDPINPTPTNNDNNNKNVQPIPTTSILPIGQGNH